jgi:UDP-glucose:(glucosyl)LPS alpha-1,2-glucosyltransferase
MVTVNDELSVNARGGTELMGERLESSIDPELLSNFQIIRSRVRDLDESKVRILWLHDLPEDPESQHLANGGWNKFVRLVFVSNWQMQQYIKAYNIPPSKCVVMANAIYPIEPHEKPNDKISLAYWSTPHRGLNILVPVFQKLAETHDNIELNVFSSFSLYGWSERDEPYKPLFEQCEAHPKINYYGALPNEELREHLKNQHILAFPSTWTETSCLVLMEAMSAGMLCVHSNLGALFETAANWTTMYQYQEDVQEHAAHFYHNLNDAIGYLNDESIQSRIASQKGYADVFYNWEIRAKQWEALLQSLVNEPRELPKDEGQMFTYKVAL